MINIRIKTLKIPNTSCFKLQGSLLRKIFCPLYACYAIQFELLKEVTTIGNQTIKQYPCIDCTKSC